MRLTKILTGPALLILALAVTPARAASVLLYDATAGNRPQDQSWLFSLSVGGTSTQTAVPQGVNLVSSTSAFVGYSNYTVAPTTQF